MNGIPSYLADTVSDAYKSKTHSVRIKNTHSWAHFLAFFRISPFGCFRLLAVWILFVHVFPGLLQISLDPDEDEFVNLYGSKFFPSYSCASTFPSFFSNATFARWCPLASTDDVNSSGIWQRARDLNCDSNDDRLKNVSYQAHRKSFTGPVEVDTAILDVRNLMFTNVNYKTIRVDVIVYKIVEAGPFFFFITKGLRPDCVFYLVKVDGRSTLLQLGKHVCGISV
jgi:hypothetical protein